MHAQKVTTSLATLTRRLFLARASVVGPAIALTVTGGACLASPSSATTPPDNPELTARRSEWPPIRSAFMAAKRRLDDAIEAYEAMCPARPEDLYAGDTESALCPLGYRRWPVHELDWKGHSTGRHDKKTDVYIWRKHWTTPELRALAASRRRSKSAKRWAQLLRLSEDWDAAEKGARWGAGLDAANEALKAPRAGVRAFGEQIRPLEAHSFADLSFKADVCATWDAGVVSWADSMEGTQPWMRHLSADISNVAAMRSAIG